MDLRSDAELVDRLKDTLPAQSEEVLSALEHFGGTLLDEMLARAALIESKAISILGWSTALLGLLLLQGSGPQAIRNPWMLRLTVLVTLVALGAAAAAARARTWPWPTIRHWFAEDQFAKPRVLRGLHLIAMLEAYLGHAAVTERKARALQVSQAAILGAGVLVAVALLFNL